MGLFQKLFGKKRPTLKEDLTSYSAWITKALNSSGYQADFSIDSLKEVDRFFDEQTCSGGLLSEHRGSKLFGLGAYIGDTLLRAYGGEWLTDDDDPQGEINVAVKLASGAVVWPVQRAMKRCENGPEDGIYAYGIAMESSSEDVSL